MNRFFALVHDIKGIRVLDLHLLETPFHNEYYFRNGRYLCIPTHTRALLRLTPITGIIYRPFSTLLASRNIFFFDYILALLVTGIDQQLHQIAKAKHGYIIVSLLTLPIKPKASEPQ
jgi:hypothetical protein